MQNLVMMQNSKDLHTITASPWALSERFQAIVRFINLLILRLVSKACHQIDEREIEGHRQIGKVKLGFLDWQLLIPRKDCEKNLKTWGPGKGKGGTWEPYYIPEPASVQRMSALGAFHPEGMKLFFTFLYRFAFCLSWSMPGKELSEPLDNCPFTYTDFDSTGTQAKNRRPWKCTF